MDAEHRASWFLEKADLGVSYAAYRDAVRQAVDAGRTTGDHQTPELAEYTVLNQARMDRLDKTVRLDPDLREALEQVAAQSWLVLSEGWCGDAAQNLPVIAAMADSAPAIRLSVLGRDAHPDLMDRYLTQGSRSIPKLVAINEAGTELFTWGPRPGPAQRMILENKALPLEEQLPYPELARKLHTWYAQDRTATLQAEFIALLKP